MSAFIKAFTPNESLKPGASRIVHAIWILMILGAWQHMATGVLPAPLDVLASFPDLLSKHALLPNIGVTLWTNIQALAIASIISLGFAYLSVLHALKPAVSLFTAIRFCGFAGVTIVCTLLFHSDHGIKVALLVFGMVGFYIASMHDVIRTIPSVDYDYARTLGLGEWATVWHVTIRTTRAQAWDAFRVNSAMGWLLLSYLEGPYRSEGGIGVMFANLGRAGNIPGQWGVQITIVFTGVLLDAFVYSGKRVNCAYAFLKTEGKS